jgi:hypothetical protein
MIVMIIRGRGDVVTRFILRLSADACATRLGEQVIQPVSPRSFRRSWSLLRADGASGGSHRHVQRHGGANERLQRLCTDLVPSWKSMARLTLPSRLALKRPEGSLSEGALGEGQLHYVLAGLTGADDSGVLPHRNPSPLPLLDHFGIGLFDETRASISPANRPSAAILASIS